MARDRDSAKDSMNLLEDEFAASFLRRTPGTRTAAAAAGGLPGLSPRLHGVYGLQASASPRLPAAFGLSVSPRLPSALPPSASPRVVEPVTPDRGQPVLPFYSAEDVIDVSVAAHAPEGKAAAEERLRYKRLELGDMGRRVVLPVTDDGVVDEVAADALFRDVPRKPRSSGTRVADQVGQVVFTLPSPTEVAAASNSMSMSMPSLSPPPFASQSVHPYPTLAGAMPSEQGLPPLRPIAVGLQASARQQQQHLQQQLPVSLSPLLPHAASSGGSTSPGVGLMDTRPAKRMKTELGLTQPQQAYNNGFVLQVSSAAQPVESKPRNPLQCEQCGSVFARKSNLFKHQRSVHAQTRPFVCSVCSYAFKRLDHLTKHQKGVHAKVRKFHCEICGISFAQKYNALKHERSIHNTARAFRCPCGAYFQHRDRMLDCLRCKRHASAAPAI